jgi:hypothetical protein
MGLDDNRAPVTTDTRIYNCDVNGAPREERYSATQDQRSGTNILRRDVVGKINNPSDWCYTKNDPFHDPDERIARAEVSEKSDKTGRGRHKKYSFTQT